MRDQLWAPWRMAYLESAGQEPGCFMCEYGRGLPGGAGEAIVVWRGTRVYALMNAYPYANGHVLLAPYVHEGALDRLDAATAAELMDGLRLMIAALRHTYNPQGFNVGANLGKAAGAGFGDHLHFHVVPRWSGDTNFMATTAGTRVIPEAIEVSAERLRASVAAVQQGLRDEDPTIDRADQPGEDGS